MAEILIEYFISVFTEEEITNITILTIQIAMHICIQLELIIKKTRTQLRKPSKYNRAIWYLS